MKKEIPQILIFLTFSLFHFPGFSQNVGINTTTPLGKLHVKGSSDVSQLIIDDLYSLTYAEFVVPLVKGMQEQQAIIERQQAQIDELKLTLNNVELAMKKLQSDDNKE